MTQSELLPRDELGRLPAGFYRYAGYDSSAELVEEAKSWGWGAWLVDGETVQSKAEFIEAIATALALPKWQGKNWDALEEALRDLPETRRGDNPAQGYLIVLNTPRDWIRAHPGEVTLIAIGPLFTVQAAIEKDPGTFRKLKRVVLMGGSVERGYDNSKGERQPPAPEWNIDRDPKGAQALFAAGVPIAMMPLDSTQIHLETKERERIFAHGSAVTDQITLLYHQWMAGSEWHTATPTLFDPVTVAYVLHPELCPTKPMRIEVDEKGMTRAVDGKPNAEVCLASDEKGFMELLLNRLTGQEK